MGCPDRPKSISTARSTGTEKPRASPGPRTAAGCNWAGRGGRSPRWSWPERVLRGPAQRVTQPKS
eukprot:1354314-Pyramimonas_sp.AAC.1